MLFRLVNRAVRELCARTILDEAPDDYVVELREPTRSLNDNARMWVKLDAISHQLQWPILICGQWKHERMSPEDWKDFLTASFEGELRRMARGIDGTGLVMLGARTSKYGKKKFREFEAFIDAFADQFGVDIPPPPFYGEENV